MRIPFAIGPAYARALSSALFQVLNASAEGGALRNENGANTSARIKGAVVVIEPGRQMQHLLRAMLTSYGIRSVRMFADTERAATYILNDPPEIVLLDWEAGPYFGPNFLKLFRHQNMYPVCLVPIIVMFSEARKAWVERAMRLGAQAVVVKPIAPTALMERISWVLNGGSSLILKGEHYVVDGIEERLEVERERQGQLKSAREFTASQFAEMDSIQNDIDKILTGTF